MGVLATVGICCCGSNTGALFHVLRLTLPSLPHTPDHGFLLDVLSAGRVLNISRRTTPLIHLQEMV